MRVKFHHFIGIDVSKLKVDACAVIDADKASLHYETFEQSRKGFKAMGKWIDKLLRPLSGSEVLICVENTGLYDDALLSYLNDPGYSVCLENAMLIKQSVRDRRAKNDKLDARNIALYALQHAHELELWQKPRQQVEALKHLLSQRSCLVNSLKGLKQSQQESDYFKWTKGKSAIHHYQNGIKGLQKDIQQIEKDIWELIKSDESLLQMFMLIISIPSVGKVTAAHFICYTNEFKRVKSGKHLASYCGVVPFIKISGSSIRNRPRVSHQANKVLKKLLHLCATSALRMKGEFAAYYRRKLEEGKQALTVLNAICNKLVLRIAAVIKNQKPYDENYIYQP